jgi:hypothetical protein
MTPSIDDRKTFLLEASRLYDAMIRMTTSEVIRRYLAFRIIVNAMAFEDLIGRRTHARFRQIRDVLLAHKQEADFFAGYRAADEIKDATVSPLLAAMAASTVTPDPAYVAPELADRNTHKVFSDLMRRVFEKYHADFLGGFRIINNHLCYTGSSIHEVSAGNLPGVFYRYHSSMAIFQLAQYTYNNTNSQPELRWTARHAKLDMLLHAQNLADTVFRDSLNSHSIDGLVEVMATEQIGSNARLLQLQSEAWFTTTYARIRTTRNKLIGHMDKQAPLPDLLGELDAIPVLDIYHLVNTIDRAIFDVSSTHIALRARYSSGNQPINNPMIVDIPGLTPASYF